MTPDQIKLNQFRLPELRATLRLNDNAFWDVKFCPFYSKDDSKPVFALISSRHLIIGRVEDESELGMTILQITTLDASPDASQSGNLNSCTWCYVQPEQPLVAVAGDDGQVVVVNALTGKVFTTLLGHGIGTVNDLATHPIYPWIISSASMDASARIWDLRRAHDSHESTCVIICGHGQAHEEGLLTIAWHNRGRYLITGGHDQKICVWTLPDLAPESDFWQSIAKENRQRSADEVHVVHYPHFISSAIHNNYVDKVVFFGDLILSKAAEENKIVLWQITGFNSRQKTPPSSSAPKTSEYLDTRNGFIRRSSTIQDGQMVHLVDEMYKDRPPYQRLLEFDAPYCKWFYMRFGFLQPSPAHPELHPTLAIGDRFADILFWDLERLILGHDGGISRPKKDIRDSDAPARTSMLRKGIANRLDRNELRNSITYNHASSRQVSPGSSMRSPSVATTATSHLREPSTEATSQSSEIGGVADGPVINRVKYALDDPHKPLKAHKVIKKGFHWTARAADWSICGRWCLVVGDADGVGVASITRRPGSLP